MKKRKQVRGHNWQQIGVFFGLGVLGGIMLLVAIARLTWHSKFYPGVSVAEIEVAGLTREQAREKLSQAIDEYQAKLIFNGSSWEVPKGAVEFEIEGSLNEAYHYGRRAKIEDYLLLLVNKKTNYPLHLLEGKTEAFEEFISEVAGVIEIAPIEPVIEVVGKKIKINNGRDGVILSGDELDKTIRQTYAQLSQRAVVLPTQMTNQQLREDELAQIRERAEKLMSASLQLQLDDEKIKLLAPELVSFLSTKGGGEILNPGVIEEYVGGLSKSLDKEPQDARFEFVGGVVKEFSPGKNGVAVNLQFTIYNLQNGLQKLLEEEVKTEMVEIVAVHTPPKVTTDKVNELGIRERIGRGESYYAHSIANRIFNIELASSRVNSALIAPGEEFSFNQRVGEISGATGYRTAYVISGGRTVLGDGGGVCQVSTTVFRAAMSAGLPITERWAHAYRVGYYEQNSKPGIDATVYSPSKDLRFRNDTPEHILIQTINEPTKQHLTIEIYGTSDGRVASVGTPKVWGVSPPPPDIYQDDPILPVGKISQVDWAAWGARASFEYKVVRGDEVLQEKTFSSSYRPWANVYLRGTGN